MTPAASSELYEALVDALYAMDPLFRPYSQWVMDPEWLDKIDQMVDAKGKKLWKGPRSPWILGKPWVLRPDGGFPHLEVTPVEVPPAKARIA